LLFGLVFLDLSVRLRARFGRPATQLTEARQAPGLAVFSSPVFSVDDRDLFFQSRLTSSELALCASGSPENCSAFGQSAGIFGI
jgi:hypothetical protein